MTRDEMIIKNQNLVYYVIKRLNLFKERDICYDLGIIGLIKGVDTFDENKGKLSTYLYRCIRNEILMYLRKKRPQTLSLEDKLADNLTIEDTLSSNINFAKDIEHKEILEQGLKVLTNKEREILIKKYGLFGTKIHTQLELSNIYNLSQSYICRIIKSAIEKMRKEVGQC